MEAVREFLAQFGPGGAMSRQVTALVILASAAALLAGLVLRPADIARRQNLQQNATMLALALAQAGISEQGGQGQNFDKAGASALLRRAAEINGWRIYLYRNNKSLFLDSAKIAYGGWINAARISAGERALRPADRDLPRALLHRARDAGLAAEPFVARAGWGSGRLASAPVQRVRQVFGAVVIYDNSGSYWRLRANISLIAVLAILAAIALVWFRFAAPVYALTDKRVPVLSRLAALKTAMHQLAGQCRDIGQKLPAGEEADLLALAQALAEDTAAMNASEQSLAPLLQNLAHEQGADYEPPAMTDGEAWILPASFAALLKYLMPRGKNASLSWHGGGGEYAITIKNGRALPASLPLALNHIAAVHGGTLKRAGRSAVLTIGRL